MNSNTATPTQDQQLAHLLKENEGEFAMWLAAARHFYRKYPDLVTAEKFPDQFRAAYANGDPDEFEVEDPRTPEAIESARELIERYANCA